MTIHSAEYVHTDDRLTCDECGTSTAELRAMPGPEPQDWLCYDCCWRAAPELNFDKLELVQGSAQ